MKKHKIFFAPNNGEINYEIDGQFDRIILSLRPKRHVMTIEEYRRNRSSEQNRYYWGIIMKMISDETGYLPDEVHQLMAQKFLGTYEKNGHTFVKSTTRLNTAEMEEYHSQIRMFASMELHLYIPLPNERHWMEVS